MVTALRTALLRAYALLALQKKYVILIGQQKDARFFWKSSKSSYIMAVSFLLSPAAQPKKIYQIQGAFTVKRLGLAEHTHPVTTLKQKYQHLCGLPLQNFYQVCPVFFIGSDNSHLFTPVEPVCIGLPGGPGLDTAGSSASLHCPAVSLYIHGAPKRETSAVMLRNCDRWMYCHGTVQRPALGHIKTRRD